MRTVLNSSWITAVSCKCVLTTAIISVLVQIVIEASLGDRSWKFHKCLAECNLSICVDEEKFWKSHPLHLQLLQWSCLDECKYSCMWETVEAFQKDNTRIPQFYGKWPFVRLWGIQEPASTIFSLLNGLGHLGIFYFRSKVPKQAPMYYVWHGFAIVCGNAWFWSTVFHIRDKKFTEMMDYFCAFSLVVYNLFSFCCRVLGTKIRWRIIIPSICLVTFYLSHIAYLGLVKFDYGYNMKVNMCTAVVNMVAWLTWCYKHKKKQPYVINCAIVVIGLNVLVLLEIFDLPPFLWVFDAHSLWHAGTIPLLYPWYRFITEDCLYLQAQEEDESLKLD